MFNKRKMQSASSKTKEIYVKNKIDITVYSEMHVVTLCCREGQMKIAEEHYKSDCQQRQHITCFGLASPDLGLDLGLVFFIVLYAPVPEDQREQSKNCRTAVQVGIVSNANM